MASLLQAWADAPTGAITDHHIVKDIFRQAVENAVLMQAVTPVRVEGGGSFTIPSVSSLAEPTDATLDELMTIPLDKLTITSRAINLSEEGRGVQMPRKALNRYRDVLDLIAEHREPLMSQQKRRLDTVVANVLDDMVTKYVATGVASATLTTNGTPGAAALANMNVYHARRMRNYLVRTALVPPRGNGRYLGFFSTASISSIKDDPEFVAYQTGVGAGQLAAGGFQGSVENIDFIEVIHTNALSDTIGTNADVGEGFVVGANCCYFGMLEAPAIYTGWSDFSQRFYNLAWHGDFAAGLPNTSANAGFPRGLHFSST